MNKPLSILLAPNSIKEILGQEHLIGKDKILSNLVKNGKLFSMILYGPPGIGKTSIANAIVKDLNVHYRMLNATINNKHDIDTVIEEAKMYDGLILIIDEIHRLNKDKQDILLPQIESGLITLIGLTTSNPYHAINPAIRSRCQLFELKPLSSKNIKTGLKNAIKSPYLEGIKIDNKSIDYIASLSSNDLRYAYNLLEIAYYSTSDKNITIDILKSINNKPIFLQDKNMDGYYDTLSGFQKSIRGSDVDASLHYLARLLASGDLDSIYRRLSVICYEDIGLANPNMGPKVASAIYLSQLTGLPEARIILSNIVIELALSPKSNSAYLAIEKALNDVETGRCGPVPDHLRNPSSTYKYPHDYPNSYVVQQYLPDNLINKHYYIPKASSINEQTLKKIKEKLDAIKNEAKQKH